MSNRPPTNLSSLQKDFVKLIQANARSCRTHDVFRDFCEMFALALSNAVDRKQYEQREAQYMRIVGKYTREEVLRFPLMRELVVDMLEAGFDDCLGQLFMSLDLGNSHKGQFFTPYSISSMMAQITLSDAKSIIEKNGFIRVSEPTVGAGGMVIAAAEALQKQGFSYQECMHVIAQDIDETAVHMAYIQASLFHIPAIVIHGNSLHPKRDTWGYWYTPAHILGNWNFRLSQRDAIDLASQAIESLAADPVPEPFSIASGMPRQIAPIDPASQLSFF